ncbi:MAG: 50S ribosomal protein L13 [Patescibacteria group bacterium]|nr:50S ribosomal protein L13 [Patescibacteria group bacterium]
MVKVAEKIKQKEIIEIDAENKSLGRLASLIAYYLQGKHRSDYRPYIDFLVYVNLKNWRKIDFTGDKLNKKYVYKHTGYWGHLRKYSLKYLWDNRPLLVIKKAVAGMLPKNKLRKKRLMRIKLVEN